MVGFDKEVYCTTCCPKVGLAQDSTDTSKIKGNHGSLDPAGKKYGKTRVAEISQM